MATACSHDTMLVVRHHPDQYPSNLGRTVTIGGKRKQSASTAYWTKIKGQISAIYVVIDKRQMPDTTNRMMPTGGVIPPSVIFITKRNPK